MSAAIATAVAKSSRDTQSTGEVRLLSVRDIAQLLGMSTRWVHERTRRREIPCYRFGSVLRFHPVEVQEWLIQWREMPVGARG
jgi:excisionase family DNA binding protein